MKSMIKDAAVLFAITLIAGLLLGGVYQITKEPIAYQKALALEKACREVFEDAASFEEMQEFDENAEEEWLKENGFGGNAINSCQIARDAAGSTMGYVMTVTTHEGYAGDIQFTLGIRMDGTINGISLLSISETPGLGMQAEDVLVHQFAQKAGFPFVVVKNGAKDPLQIDAISGATVTSDAMTGGVNAGVYYFYEKLSEGGGTGGK